jgi:chromosome segregation ATPase
MLSKALRVQQEKEDMELSTLQDEVEKLRSSLEEKEVEVKSLKEKVAEAERIHSADVTKAKEQDNLINELRANLDATKEDIASKDGENQKLLATLNQLRDKCFAIASRCCDNMKKFLQLRRPPPSRAATPKGPLVGSKKN